MGQEGLKNEAKLNDARSKDAVDQRRLRRLICVCRRSPIPDI